MCPVCCGDRVTFRTMCQTGLITLKRFANRILAGRLVQITPQPNAQLRAMWMFFPALLALWQWQSCLAY
eukprot:331059-Chlamydomonas_euryale.AAC.1